MSKFIILLLALTLAAQAEPLAAASTPSKQQIFDSALAYDRSVAEAQEAASVVDGLLALQVYLTLSTPAYRASQRQALEAVRSIRTQFTFQIYLTLRTPLYGLPHEQSLVASGTLPTQESFQLFLHLLATGWNFEIALSRASQGK